MRVATYALVIVAVAVLGVTAVGPGAGAAGLTILVLVLIVGALGIAVARRWRTEGVQPASCADCGGLISPHSPYCKHCGARRPVRR